MTQIKKATYETRNIKDLQKWDDNPRTVVRKEFERLKQQITELGLYRPLLINQNNIILGGNTTYSALVELGYDGDVEVSVVDATTPDRMLEYALSANDQVGVTDDLKLAELVHLSPTPINMQLYKVQSSILRPLESIINPRDPATEGGGDGRDESELGQDLDTFLNATVKQIVLFFGNDEYASVIERLDKIAKELNLKNNTEVFIALLEFYEKSREAK